MKFDKNHLIKLLEINLNFNVVKDELFGKVIKLAEQDAYRFCLTTNSYYLVDKYGLRLFGRFRTFNHRNYSLNQGLFLIETKNEEIVNNNLPQTLFLKYPFIFEGAKKIVFIESKNTSTVIEDTYNKIIAAGKNPKEYILNIVNTSGAQWEHYFEFMASEIFIRKGFFTDIQLPWSYHGTPDFGVYKHKLIDILKSVNLIENGALVLELSALRLFNKGDNRKSKKIPRCISELSEYEFRVGEVKTTQKKSQILEYIKTGLCFKAYEFMPKKDNHESYCGLIKITSEDKIVIDDGPVNPYFKPKKMKEDLEWFESYIKIHLLGNLSLEELKLLFEKELGESKLTFLHLIKLVKKITFKNLLEVVNNGI